MHLVSAIAQRVHIPGAGLDSEFAEGESIWTESSYKYEPEGVAAMGARAGLAARAAVDRCGRAVCADPVRALRLAAG